MRTKCHRIISEDSQNLQRYIRIINSYIHVYNSLGTLLKPPSFSALFSLKRNSAAERTRDCYLKTLLYAGPVFIYHELFKSW